MSQVVWMYTITYKTGKINEKRGVLYDRHGACGGLIWHDMSNPRKYQTNCPLVEGEIRGASIWFLEPNLEAAKKAFAEKANTMRREYFEKFLGAEERSQDQQLISLSHAIKIEKMKQEATHNGKR